MSAELSLGSLRPGAARARRSSSNGRARSTVSRALWGGYQVALLALLYFGWINRNERHWTPEHGFGYWLGIAGVAALLLLLVYPLRKRIRALAAIGNVPFWFRTHMALGMAAPALILLHCNFKSQSANASVALYAMLIVAASGFIGRYLHARIYSRINGRRLEAVAFFDEAREEMAALGEGGAAARLSAAPLEALTLLTEDSIRRQNSLTSALLHRRRIARRSRHVARDLVADLEHSLDNGVPARVLSRRERRRQLRVFERQVASHCQAIRRAASLNVYERLFSLWHILHLPLFAMLVVAVIVHVLAVHLY